MKIICTVCSNKDRRGNMIGLILTEAAFPTIPEMDKTNGKPVKREDVVRFGFHRTHKRGLPYATVMAEFDKIDRQIEMVRIGALAPKPTRKPFIPTTSKPRSAKPTNRVSPEAKRINDAERQAERERLRRLDQSATMRGQNAECAARAKEDARRAKQEAEWVAKEAAELAKLEAELAKLEADEKAKEQDELEKIELMYLAERTVAAAQEPIELDVNDVEIVEQSTAA
jgi:hypothetical protein